MGHPLAVEGVVPNFVCYALLWIFPIFITTSITILSIIAPDSSSSLNQQNQSAPAGLSGQFCGQVIDKITHFGLYKLKEQYLHIKRQKQHEEED